MSLLALDKAYVQRRLDIDGYDVFMLAKNFGAPHHRHIVTEVSVTIVTDTGDGTPVAPASAPLIMDVKTAQILFQALWDAGLRPNSGESSSAHIAALKDHLEDMRKLAFMAHLPEPEVLVADRPKTKISHDF